MQTLGDTVFELMESDLEELCLRIPGVPVTSILLYRVIHHLAHGIAAMLEQHIRPYGLKEVEFRVLTVWHTQAIYPLVPRRAQRRYRESAMFW
jgi:hypothetical protein